MTDELRPEIEAIVKKVLRDDKSDQTTHQKSLNDFFNVYTPKKFGEKKTYPQNWPIYYQACQTEKLAFFRILGDAVESLEIPSYYQGNGRPCANTTDIIKALCIKGYCGLSSWRVHSELQIAKAMGVIEKVYKRSALNKYLGNPEITRWLHELYQLIAEPIEPLETQLATDSTGISVAYGRKRWVEVRTEHRLHRDYKKLHIISGAKSNIIFIAEITKGTAHDSPVFRGLIDKLRFSAKELSADSGYLSKENVSMIVNKGMFPYILPKKNTRAKNRGNIAWGRMIKLWKQHQDLFAMHYHQRSNVESTFGMLKRKFGYYIRAKSEIGQTNEILAKIVCLNACILAEAILEFNLKPEFMVT